MLRRVWSARELTLSHARRRRSNIGGELHLILLVKRWSVISCSRSVNCLANFCNELMKSRKGFTRGFASCKLHVDQQKFIEALLTKYGFQDGNLSLHHVTLMFLSIILRLMTAILHSSDSLSGKCWFFVVSGYSFATNVAHAVLVWLNMPLIFARFIALLSSEFSSIKFVKWENLDECAFVCSWTMSGSIVRISH